MRADSTLCPTLVGAMDFFRNRGTNFETHFCDPDCQHHVPGRHLLQGSASAKPWEQNLVGKTAKIPGTRMINVLQRRTVEAHHRIVDMNNISQYSLFNHRAQQYRFCGNKFCWTKNLINNIRAHFLFVLKVNPGYPISHTGKYSRDRSTRWFCNLWENLRGFHAPVMDLSRKSNKDKNKKYHHTWRKNVHQEKKMFRGNFFYFRSRKYK